MTLTDTDTAFQFTFNSYMLFKHPSWVELKTRIHLGPSRSVQRECACQIDAFWWQWRHCEPYPECGLPDICIDKLPVLADQELHVVSSQAQAFDMAGIDECARHSNVSRFHWSQWHWSMPDSFRPGPSQRRPACRQWISHFLRWHVCWICSRIFEKKGRWLSACEAHCAFKTWCGRTIGSRSQWPWELTFVSDLDVVERNDNLNLVLDCPLKT